MIVPGKPGERANGANTFAPFEASRPVTKFGTERLPLVTGRLDRVSESPDVEMAKFTQTHDGVRAPSIREKADKRLGG
jgi:hypothetical protein